MKHIVSLVRRAVDKFDMIPQGGRVAVGLSGGKDSLTLLWALSQLKEYHPSRFELCAITLDMGFPDSDFSPLSDFCNKIGVPFHLIKTDIAPVIFDIRKEENPCSLCAKMRRGSLVEAALSLGFDRIALGHHYDDAVETFFLSLFYEGRINCFMPVTFLDRTGVTQIRPMLYVEEQRIISAVKRHSLPVCKNPCPANKHTKREYIKKLTHSLSQENNGLKKRIFGAIERYPLKGWEK